MAEHKDIQEQARARLEGLNDKHVMGLLEPMLFKDFCEEYKACNTKANADDLVLACIQYALQQTFPEIFEEEEPYEEQQPKVSQEGSKQAEEVE